MKGKSLPPTYFFVCLLLEVGLHFIFPVRKFIHRPYSYSGIVLIAIGIWLNIWADRLFKENCTTVKPFEEPVCFIEKGPFRFTRNPMYLGMVLILLGGAVFLGSIISFIFPVIFFIIMGVIFIRREEKSLEKTFGSQFEDYEKRVRRWL